MTGDEGAHGVLLPRIQPRRAVGQAAEAACRGEFLEPAHLLVAEQVAPVPEEDDVGVDADDLAQPQSVDAGAQGVEGHGIGRVVGGVVVPHGGGVGADPDGVEEPDRGHHRGAGTEEEGLLARGSADDPDTAPVGVLPVDLLVAATGNRRGVDEVQLEVAEAPLVNGPRDRLMHDVARLGPGQVQGMVGGAPVGAGHSRGAVGTGHEELGPGGRKART